MTEDEMVGWHHRLSAHWFRWTPGVDGQGGLACCASRGHTAASASWAKDGPIGKLRVKRRES